MSLPKRTIPPTPSHSFLTSLGLLLSRSHEQSNLVDAQSLGIFVNVTGIVVFFLIVIYHYIVTEPKSKKEETE